MANKVTVERVKQLIAKVQNQLREEDQRRRSKGLMRPEEPGLTEEARHFQITF